MTGLVTDEAGAGVGRATVAALSYSGSHALGLAETDESGVFTFDLAPGHYRFTATAPNRLPASETLHVVDDSRHELKLTVAQHSSANPIRSFSGVVRRPDGTGLPSAALGFESWGRTRGTFYTRTDASGRYAVSLAGDSSYIAILNDPAYATEWPLVSGELAASFDVVAHSVPMEPFVPAAASWLKTSAHPLVSTDPQAPLDDLTPLRDLASGTRVLGLGEATHGTRDFFQLKHRVFRYLVEEHGFRVFAIEGSWPDARPIDEYLITGEGDPDALLHALGFWIWDTQEVLELLRWMRGYNEKAKPRDRIRFYGFDIQAPGSALKLALADAGKLGVQGDAEALSYFDRARWSELREASNDERQAALAAVDALEAKIKKNLRARPSRLGRLALQNVRVLRQVDDLAHTPAGETVFSVRDSAMANNIQAILEIEGENARVALWAHNVHLAKAPKGFETLGMHLEEMLGDDYRVLAFMFQRGRFRARDGLPKEHSQGIIHADAEPAPAGFWESLLSESGLNLAYLNLIAVPEGLAKGPFAAPRPMRDYGAVYYPEPHGWQAIRLLDYYDALVFVKETVASHVFVRPGRRVDGVEPPAEERATGADAE